MKTIKKIESAIYRQIRAQVLSECCLSGIIGTRKRVNADTSEATLKLSKLAYRRRQLKKAAEILHNIDEVS